MSILKDEAVSYGRLLGLYRYLLHTSGQREVRKLLEELLSPRSLVATSTHATRVMIESTIDEALKAGLLVEKDGTIALPNDLLLGLASPSEGERMLPAGLAQLFFGATSGRNHDLGHMIAWFLTQDPAEGMTNHQAFERRLKKQGILDRLPHTDVNYGHFRNWICDLGLAWRWGRKHNESLLTPDPTTFIRRLIPILLPKPDVEVPLGEVLAELANLCPVFEGGDLRRTVEAWPDTLKRRSNRHLAPSSAMAWLRLDGEGSIRLLTHADAEAWALPDGDQDKRYTHVSRVSAEAWILPDGDQDKRYTHVSRVSEEVAR